MHREHVRLTSHNSNTAGKSVEEKQGARLRHGGSKTRVTSKAQRNDCGEGAHWTGRERTMAVSCCSLTCHTAKTDIHSSSCTLRPAKTQISEPTHSSSCGNLRTTPVHMFLYPRLKGDVGLRSALVKICVCLSDIPHKCSNLTVPVQILLIVTSS